MLIWMCALNCEAKPVIDRYRLRKSTRYVSFDLYHNDDVTCVVSGVGDLNMAAACAWTAALLRDRKGLCWVNLGTAGHKDLAAGTALLASKIDQAGRHAAIYPVPLIKYPFQALPIISLTGESVEYDEGVLFDMEAYAFVHSASRFSPLELCQSIKIVSDNSSTPPARDKARTSRLIAGNMPAIAAYAAALQELATDFAHQSIAAEQMQPFVALAHFTQSQRIQLRKTLLGLRTADPELGEAYAAARQLDTAKQILDALQRRLHASCETF